MGYFNFYRRQQAFLNPAEIFNPLLQSFLFSIPLQLCECALDSLNFHTLHTRRHHLAALFLVKVYDDFKCCPSLLENSGIHVPSSNISDFPMFPVGF
jgi:hypothetical protein